MWGAVLEMFLCDTRWHMKGKIHIQQFSLWWCKLTSVETWTLTFLLSHAEEKNDGTEDIDWADDTGGNHVSCFLQAGTKEERENEQKHFYSEFYSYLVKSLFAWVINTSMITVCSREMTGSVLLSSVVLLFGFSKMSPGPGRQGALAMPTIWPWMAVPSTVPRTSTVIPDWRTDQ